MKRKAPNAALTVHDYRPALQGALSWLGNRYLLAEPAPRKAAGIRPSSQSLTLVSAPNSAND